jgi:hypothetical protein
MRPTENIEKRIENVKIVVDAEANERVFGNILQAFGKSETKQSAETQPNMWRTIIVSRITRAAAIIVVIAAIGFSVFYRSPGEQAATDKTSEVAKSPAEMLTFMSLSMAYRRGGIEALEQQCEKAFEMLGPRPAAVSTQDLLTELNGS